MGIFTEIKMRNLKNVIDNATHFTYGELIKSDTAIRLGINNEPDEEQWQCLEKLAVNVLEPIREEFGPIRVTSGFRSSKLCEAIGSSIYSNHTRGQAADIEPVNIHIQLVDILEWIYYNLDYRELIAEFFPDGWIHVAYRENGNNKTLKLKDVEHQYEEVDIYYIKHLYS